LIESAVFAAAALSIPPGMFATGGPFVSVGKPVATICPELCTVIGAEETLILLYS
jgi:hypothetical protein